jgi:serine protease AprX
LTDPLCQAVARAVGQGLVVVASAGNNGRSPSGAPVLGGIASPGNSPFALTVGALNTLGTAGRGDDRVAEYSSRGPARWDLAVKPDLVAPGTHIVSLEAGGSYLPANYPAVHVAGAGSNAYMQLSGTSMATPMVTGAVALLLQGSPGLSASQVKLALQAGATYVADSGLMGAGAGSLNIVASRRIAASGLSQLTVPIAPEWGSSGASFSDAGTLAAQVYAGTGVHLVSLLDLGRVWVNPALLPFGDLNLLGMLNPLRFAPANRLLWGDQVSSWATGGEQIIWGTTMSDPHGDQIIWGTSDADGQIIWGTSTLTDPGAQ